LGGGEARKMGGKNGKNDSHPYVPLAWRRGVKRREIKDRTRAATLIKSIKGEY